MKKNVNFVFCNKIQAVLPAYDQYGANICHTILSNGEKEFASMDIRKFIKAWLRTFKLTVHGQLVWAECTNHCRNLNPILINKHLVLLPVKVREPIGSNDGCYGYVNLGNIESFDQDSILLHSGVRIPYLSSYDTLSNKIHQATFLRYVHIDEISGLLGSI